MRDTLSKETLIENVSKHFQAIEVCLQNHLRMPALILIYSGIDIFASLGRPADKDNATRKDYIEWCENYIIPQGKISCSGVDLYAARCGVVHTYTMESSLSEEGKAKQIVYAWGNRKPDDLQEVIDKVGFTQRVIHIDILAEVFREGASIFLSELDSDPERAELVVSRAGKLFRDQPDEF